MALEVGRSPAGAEGSEAQRPRRAGVMVALGLALLCLGSGAVLIVTSARTGEPEVRGGVRPVNAGATDLSNIDANNSPTVTRSATDPDRVVVVNRVDTPLFSCAMHVSSDGGSSWSPVDIPFPAGEEEPPRCFAPDAVFGPDGRLAVSFVTLIGRGNTPNAAWVVTSEDGGRTLSTAVRATGPMAFHTRLSADPQTPGRLYLSWVQAMETGTLAFAGSASPVTVARSDDWGTTFHAPVRASPDGRARLVAPSPAVGPGGVLHVLYLDLDEDVLDYHGAHQGKGGEPYPGRWSLVLARSVDRGVTWVESVVDPSVAPVDRVIVLFPAAPSLGVDPTSGAVHVAFHDARQGDADVLVWSSPDGITFGPPVRVNDTPVGDGRRQYLPKVAVAPGGRVDVAYYDRRDDREDVMNEVSLQSSDDGGTTFGARLRISDRAFDSRVGFGSERGLPDLGSRLGLVSTQGHALVVWTDTRFGTEASNKQDLGRALVAFPSEPGWTTPVLGMGISALSGGLLLLVLAALGRGLWAVEPDPSSAAAAAN